MEDAEHPANELLAGRHCPASGACASIIRTFVLFTAANPPPSNNRRVPLLGSSLPNGWRRARGAHQGLEPALGPLQSAGIPQQPVSVVIGESDAVEVVRELLGIDVRAEVAFFDGDAHRS